MTKYAEKIAVNRVSWPSAERIRMDSKRWRSHLDLLALSLPRFLHSALPLL